MPDAHCAPVQHPAVHYPRISWASPRVSESDNKTAGRSKIPPKPAAQLTACQSTRYMTHAAEHSVPTAGYAFRLSLKQVPLPAAIPNHAMPSVEGWPRGAD